MTIYYRAFLTTSLFLACFILILLNVRTLQQHPYELSLPNPVRKHAETTTEVAALPTDYTTVDDEPSFCADRFGITYLTKLAESATRYCTSASPSQITCFHSQTALDDHRWDTFCFLENARLDRPQHKYNVGCELVDLAKSPFPRYGRFHNYWYNTGPGVVLDTWVQRDMEIDGIPPSDAPNYTILVKREGYNNYWHSLMEIYSMTLTMDALQMTHPPDEDDDVSGRPFMTAQDATNTQLVLLDDYDEGPFFDLWSLFAKRGVVRFNDLPSNSDLGNIIIPLAGGSNTLWQGDWKINTCKKSALLHTFTQRVLSFYELGHDVGQQQETIVLTFINRRKGRRLIKADEYLQQVMEDFPLVKVQSIDFGAIPYKTQLEIIRKTDVLVGVHGAGLTHGIFLSPGSSIVEILPSDLNHKGFRNVASLQGHSYFSVHASEPPRAKRSDWHSDDVFLEKDKFMDVMNVAIKSVYNRGLRSYDVG